MVKRQERRLESLCMLQSGTQPGQVPQDRVGELRQAQHILRATVDPKHTLWVFTATTDIRLSAEGQDLSPCHSDAMGSATAKPPGSAVMSFKARLCLHKGRDKSVRNVLVASGFLQQNSSTYKFSHYLLRRSHLTYKARSQCGAGWPTATHSSHPGWLVSNIHTGCPALRVSIKGLPGVPEEGCVWMYMDL